MKNISPLINIYLAIKKTHHHNHRIRVEDHIQMILTSERSKYFRPRSHLAPADLREVTEFIEEDV